MKINTPKLNTRLGHDLSALDQSLLTGRSERPQKDSSTSPTPRKPVFRVVESPSPTEKTESLNQALPFLSCSLDEKELTLTSQLTDAMFKVETAEDQKETFKSYIRSLEFLNAVLLPLSNGAYSSVLIEDLPQDTILPLGRMKTTLNSEMTLYGIGRAAGLKKRNGDEVKDFNPITPLSETGVAAIDSLLPNPEDSAFTALFCHRNDRQTAIQLAEVDEVLTALPTKTRNILKENRFQLSTPSEPNHWSQATAAFFIKNNRQQLATATHNVKGIDAEAQQALFDLNALLNSGKVGKKVILKPGDALVLNNERCLHGSETHRTSNRLWLQTLLLIPADNTVATKNHLRSI